MERENIFSWRREMPRGQSLQNRQARADIYYSKLTENFKERLTQAEVARQEEDDRVARELVDTCASTERQGFLDSKLIAREKRGIGLYEARKNIDLGMAGFFRIDHVHSNSMAKKSTNLLEQNKHLKAANIAYSRRESVTRTTYTTPQTIHGGAIDWDAETTQDIANTYTILGQNGLALAALNEGIVRINDKLSYFPTIGRRETPKQELTNQDLKHIGLLSGRGVMRIRAAKITHELSEIYLGFQDIKHANNLQPYFHRLATVSLWLLQASVTYKGNLKSRINAAKSSLQNLMLCFKEDKESARNAAKQYLVNLKPVVKIRNRWERFKEDINQQFLQF